MTRELQLTILLSLVAYRATRFAIKDTLIDGIRIRVQNAVLGTKPRLWREKLHELISCPYCISWWIAGICVALADWQTSVPLPFFQWAAVAAGAVLIWRIIEE